MAMNVLNTINLTNVSSGAGSSNAKVSRSGDALDSNTSAFPAVGEQLPQTPQGEQQTLVAEPSSSSDTSVVGDEQTTDQEQRSTTSDSLPSSWLSSLFILPTATPESQPTAPVGSLVGDIAEVDMAPLPQPLVAEADIDAAPLTVTAASAATAPLPTGNEVSSAVTATDVADTQAVAANVAPLLAGANIASKADNSTANNSTANNAADAKAQTALNSLLQANAAKQNAATTSGNNVAATAELVTNAAPSNNGLAANVMALSMAVQQQLKSQSSADTSLNTARVETPAVHVASAQLTSSLETNASNNVQRQPIATDAAIGQQLLNVLKDRVQLQLDNQQQVAQIRLDPPRLGSIEVRISVEGDRTIVHLNASQSTVRDAMATTAEQLRTTLMNKLGSDVTVLTNSDTNGQSSQQQPQYLAEQIDSNSLVLDEEPLTQARQQQGWINRLA